MMTDEHWTDRVMQVVRLRDPTRRDATGAVWGAGVCNCRTLTVVHCAAAIQYTLPR